MSKWWLPLIFIFVGACATSGSLTTDRNLTDKVSKLDLGVQLAEIFIPQEMLAQELEVYFQQFRKFSSPDDKSDFNRKIAAMERATDRLLSGHGQAFVAEYGRVFSEFYTEDELLAAISFYKSEVGSSFLRKEAEVNQSAMHAAEVYLDSVFTKILEEELENAQ